jgi:hypothetical protein
MEPECHHHPVSWTDRDGVESHEVPQWASWALPLTLLHNLVVSITWTGTRNTRLSFRIHNLHSPIYCTPIRP